MRLPGLSVIEAPRCVLGGGVPLMSTPPCRCYACHSHPQSARRNVNRNAGLICSHILSTRAMCFSRRGRVRLLLIVIAAGVLASAEICKLIYHIRRCCNATSEYSPICCIGLTLLVTGFKQPLQMNDFASFDMLPFIPLHFLCTHFWQLVHCIELLPAPLLQTSHGHLTAFCLTI